MAAHEAGIAYLDGLRIARGLKAGVLRVLEDRDYLNKINVFPIPDGDTGTNLAMTLTSVQTALDGHRLRHAGRTLELVADAALDGARGNSGAIMAQFFQGISDACGDHHLLTTPLFAEAVGTGTQYARDALMEPREGTIITVLSAFSAELSKMRSVTHDFGSLLEKGLIRARQALTETTAQLEELRKAGVVDAGARGFVDLLHGVTDYVRGGSIREAGTQMGAATPHDMPSFEYDDVDRSAMEHRYCTECVITGHSIEHRKIKEALVDLGSSLVVAGTRQKARVHIHVDEPQVLFDVAAGFGSVSSRKADDMWRQSDSRQVLNDTVAIVTDSACDIPDEMMEQLNIHMVPVRVHFGNKSYLDKVSLSADEFYAELENNPRHPKTSQPAPGDFRRLYEFLGSHHPAILSIHLTGQASGTFQAAESASARAHTDTPIIAVDSRNASVGQGLIV
ncbi:MAG: DegV family protein, partial [Gammaproteobacteria bacterium]